MLFDVRLEGFDVVEGLHLPGIGVQRPRSAAEFAADHVDVGGGFHGHLEDGAVLL